MPYCVYTLRASPTNRELIFMTSLRRGHFEDQPWVRGSMLTSDGTVRICNTRWFTVLSSWSRGSVRHSTWFTSKKCCLCLICEETGAENKSFVLHRYELSSSAPCLKIWFLNLYGSADKSLSPGTYLCGFIMGAKEEEHVKNYLRLPWTQKALNLPPAAWEVFLVLTCLRSMKVESK